MVRVGVGYHYLAHVLCAEAQFAELAEQHRTHRGNSSFKDRSLAFSPGEVERISGRPQHPQPISDFNRRVLNKHT